MKINNVQMVVIGVLTLFLAVIFSFFEKRTPLTENDMIGLVGYFFVVLGSCIRKE